MFNVDNFKVGDLVTAKLTTGCGGQTQSKVAYIKEVQSSKVVVEVVAYGEGIEEWNYPGVMPIEADTEIVITEIFAHVRNGHVVRDILC